MGVIGLMKYKVGDKVKIKTWEDMEKKFGLDKHGYISCSATFTGLMEKLFTELDYDRVVTIKEKDIWYYIEKDGEGFCWSDDMIECLVKSYKEPIYESIKSRFDILDL